MSIEILKELTEAMEIASEGGGVNFYEYAKAGREAIAEYESLDTICQELQEMTYTQAMRIAELEKIVSKQTCEMGSMCLQCPDAQPKREWVRLTDEAIWSEYQTLWPFHPAEEPRLAKDIAKFGHAIEAKLKERNT
jgi:hypothetical protein